MVKEIRGRSGAGSASAHGLAPQNLSPDKHVDVCVDSEEDRGSTPLASISDSSSQAQAAPNSRATVLSLPNLGGIMATYTRFGANEIWTRHENRAPSWRVRLQPFAPNAWPAIWIRTGIIIKSPDDQGVLNAADWAVMIGAQAGPQWSFVESFRDEARLYRDLSRASTTGQWATL